MFDRAEEWCTHSGPGHWPDADMLPVGALRVVYEENTWTKFTKAEQITMMTLWCMMRSPLMIGADLPRNDAFTLSLLTNAKVLAIAKDTLCAHKLYRTQNEIAWIAPDKKDSSVYIALFNITDKSQTLTFDLSAYDLAEYTGAKELWSDTNISVADSLSFEVDAHGACVFKLTAPKA